jgi:hypothetical protein
VLGGLVYANKNSFAQKRAFVVHDSSLSLSVGEWVGRDQPFHMIEEWRAGETRLREPAAPPRRGAGSLCTLFSGYRGPGATDVPPKPSFDPKTGPGHGKGLSATYFSGEFEGLLRTGVEAVDVDFAASPPTAGRYSARWSGKIESRHTGMHHFTLDSVGTRLLIDGRLVVDAWRNNARYRNGRIHLAAGRRYDIKLEHRSDGSTHGKVRLIWSVPGHSQEVVPACQLYPADERLPQVRLTASDDCMPEQGGAVTLTAHRTGDTSKPLTVALLPRHDMTMNLTMIYAARGDAIAKQDYDGAPLELVIPAGESSKGFALRARDDPYPERPEHVLLELAPSHDYDIASRQLTVCIEDDDMPTPGSGTGLRGEYFTGKNFTDLVETRVDKQLDFNWDKRVPARGQEPRNGYSIRWTGRIQPLFSETYLIQAPTSVYSATRVWLDGEEIITFSNEGAEPNGRFGKRGSGVTYARVPLKSGRKYDLRVEYVALNFYGQKFKLLWSSDSQFEQVVPPCQLYPSGD